MAQESRAVTFFDRLVAFGQWLTSLTHRDHPPPKLRRQLTLEQAEDRTVPAITLTSYLMSGSITAGDSTGVSGSVLTSAAMSSLVVTFDWNAVNFDGTDLPITTDTTTFSPPNTLEELGESHEYDVPGDYVVYVAATATYPDTTTETATQTFNVHVGSGSGSGMGSGSGSGSSTGTGTGTGSGSSTGTGTGSSTGTGTGTGTSSGTGTGTGTGTGSSTGSGSGNTFTLTNASGSYSFTVPLDSVNPDASSQTVSLTDFTLTFGGQSVSSANATFTTSPAATISYGTLTDVSFAVSFFSPVNGYVNLSVDAGVATAGTTMSTTETTNVGDNDAAMIVLDFSSAQIDPVYADTYVLNVKYQDGTVVAVGNAHMPGGGDPGGTATGWRDIIYDAMNAKGIVVTKDPDSNTRLTIKAPAGSQLKEVIIANNATTDVPGPKLYYRDKGGATADPIYTYGHN